MTLQRKHVDIRASLIMTLLCMVWGIQQVAIKGVADEISPVLQIAIRSGVAAVLVWGFTAAKGLPLRLSLHCLLPGGLVGLLFGLQFLFVAEGLRYTSASHMAVFLYTAPTFAAIGLQLFNPDERLSIPQWVGIGVAFIGTGIAFLSRGAGGTDIQHYVAGDIMGLLAGLSWGATTVVVRCSSLGQIPASHTLFYQLAGGLILLSVYAYFTGQYKFQPHFGGIASLIFQIVIVGFASYLTWFSLMKKYSASQLGVLSFMTPVFGVIAGVMILGEQLQRGFIFGSLLIVTGICIVSGWPWFKTRLSSFPFS